jgi:hypothetical protein
MVKHHRDEKCPAITAIIVERIGVELKIRYGPFRIYSKSIPSISSRRLSLRSNRSRQLARGLTLTMISIMMGCGGPELRRAPASFREDLY